MQNPHTSAGQGPDPRVRPEGAQAWSGRRRWQAPLAFPAAALTGLLMVLSFPRHGHDWLVWVTLVPLLWAATGSGAKRGLLLGWLAGLTLESAGFLWILFAMREFSGLGRAGSVLFLPWVLYESLPWAVLGLALGVLRRRTAAAGRRRPAGREVGDFEPVPGRVFAVIPLWVGIEHIYPRLFTWQIGGALHERTWIVQAADLFGAGGLTALVLLVNVVVFLVILRFQGRARFPARSLAVAILLLAAANLYGWHRIAQVDATIAKAPELKVGVVQPVVGPEEKNARDVGGRLALFNKMDALTRSLLGNGKLDLVVWPEGADPIGYIEENDGSMRRATISRDKQYGFEGLMAPLVAGTWSLHRSTDMVRNTAEYILPERGPAGFYHKNILVLFGEYVPLWDYLPASLRERLRNVGVLEAGTECPEFALPAMGGPFRFRILICYEAILPGYVREAARGAEFLVNTTEDIWYGNTSHIGQHLSVLQMRAIENRIPIVRAANVGPSGIIDPAGRMAGRTTPYEKVERVFTLRPVHLKTLYASLGFAFPWACLAAGIGLYGLFFLGRRHPAARPGPE